jgi:hypothetical protein
MIVFKPSSLLVAASDLRTAQQIAHSLVQLHPALGNPSSDFAIEVGIAAGDLSSMFGARFGARDAAMQRLVLDHVLVSLLAIREKIDTLGEMSQSQSRNFQAAMDRLSKFSATLSRIVSSTSSAADAITRNLK